MKLGAPLFAMPNTNAMALSNTARVFVLWPAQLYKIDFAIEIDFCVKQFTIRQLGYETRVKPPIQVGFGFGITLGCTAFGLWLWYLTWFAKRSALLCRKTRPPEHPSSIPFSTVMNTSSAASSESDRVQGIQMDFGFGLSLGMQSSLRHWYGKRDHLYAQDSFSNQHYWIATLRRTVNLTA